MDANLVGGQIIIVPLSGITPRFTDAYIVIYEIPTELLMYRSIVSALSVGYLPYGNLSNYAGASTNTSNSACNCPPNEILGAASKMMNALSDVPFISNANVELIGNNTILIRDQSGINSSYQLRCVVSNDEYLNNISPRHYPIIAKACELAIKSYIYNTLIIKIDSAFLEGGQELGAFKSYIETLSDAEENYQTYLREMVAKTLFINDQMQYERFVRLQVTGGL
jgi:hypothetical protein